VIGFNQPARLALVPDLVARDSLSTAVAVNAVVFSLARFVGPALAGVLMVTAGTGAVFAANAASTLAFLAVLSRIRGRGGGEGGRRAGSLLGSVAEGLRYAARRPGIATVLALMLALSLGVRPFAELLPGFAGRVFGGGAETLALLASTIGLGAVVGGLWLAQRGDAPGLARIVLASMALAACAVLGFAASASLWTALPSAAVAGFALTTSGVGSQTLLQMAVDGAMRGRVLSLYGLLVRGGPALGALAMGAASELVGLRWPVAAGALAMLALSGLAWRARVARALEATG
jgi:predicted MFS family arabinose efflux permease